MQEFGAPPSRLMQQQRLDRARQALLEADPTTATVTRIAVQHGFTELGRFAALYRQRFGEAPARTLHDKRGGS